ncbi:MAG TPA: hypothetical protein VGH15_06545 [Caulobacteraceae bacterium]
MTYKVISTAYPSGYDLKTTYAGLLILSTGSIGGTGLKLAAAANVGNYGDISADSKASNADNGVTVLAGATIKNGSPTTHASIQGYSGVFAQNAPVNVKNYGGIVGLGPGGDGVFTVDGGQVTNGAAGDTTARIVGAYSGVTAGALATVVNFGDILSFSQTYASNGVDGVDLAAGGSVVNGSASDTGALVYGRKVGVAAAKPTQILNYGTLNGAQGVYLSGGGTVTNGSTGDASAYIYGAGTAAGYGVLARSVSATIVNFGSIRSTHSDGVELDAGGAVSNGDADHTGALIKGGNTGVVVVGAATVSNFATIWGVYNGGVVDLSAATVNNGTASDTSAEIYGKVSGVVLGAGTVDNFGDIKAVIDGVSLEGGLLINGSAGDVTALINGKIAVGISGAAGTVRNYATITATGPGNSFGADMVKGGVLTNGSASDLAAYIGGDTGVFLDAATTVTNFATIASFQGYAIEALAAVTVVNGSATDRTAKIVGVQGVALGAGGTLRNFGIVQTSGALAVRVEPTAGAGGVVVNGSATDLTALIEGAYAAYATNSTVTNFATIISTSAHAGLELSGGRLTNGSTTVTSALVSGGLAGVSAKQGASIVNFATLASESGSGALLGDHAVLVNGAAGAAGALVQGETGVSVTGVYATLQNFGVVYGTNGVAVDVTGSGDVLEVEAGCAFYGAVIGGGGTLVLDSGAGAISAFAHGGAVVSGAITPAEFSDFAAFDIAAAAKFTMAGPGNLSNGRSLAVNGSLSLGGTLTSAGAVTVTRTLAGAGTLALTGGTAAFEPGAVLTLAKITQSGGTASFTAAVLTVSHPWVQTAGTLTVGAGDRVNFTAAGDAFSGVVTGAGTVEFAGGTDVLTKATLSAASMIVNAAAVTLSGTIDLTTTLTVDTASLTVASTGATLTGAGTVSLKLATSIIKGATTSSLLTNTDKIIGTGQLGDGALSLVNTGTIDGSLTTALTINTGANTVTNSGLIENTNTGGLTITGAVANTGTLHVTKGTLSVAGAVSGAGTVKIAGGTADFGSTFTENVAFTSTTGVLELARSVTYTGQLTGLSKSGTSSLDLLDIAFTSGTTKATFSGTTTSGTLTVTDGTHTAHMTLEGNYLGHTFTASSDGHGGTKVVDPTPPPAGGGHAAPLIGAMAGFAGARGTTPRGFTPEAPARPWLLAAPALA